MYVWCWISIKKMIRKKEVIRKKCFWEFRWNELTLPRTNSRFSDLSVCYLNFKRGCSSDILYFSITHRKKNRPLRLSFTTLWIRSALALGRFLDWGCSVSWSIEGDRWRRGAAGVFLLFINGHRGDRVQSGGTKDPADVMQPSLLCNDICAGFYITYPLRTLSKHHHLQPCSKSPKMCPHWRWVRVKKLSTCLNWPEVSEAILFSSFEWDVNVHLFNPDGKHQPHRSSIYIFN